MSVRSLVHSKASVSRRAFLQGGALSVAAVSPLAAWGRSVVPSQRPASNDPSFLTGALEAAKWIRAAQVDTPKGRYWLAEPDHPGRELTHSQINGIYSGGAGIVLFFLQLAQATGDTSYLDDARRGADLLVDAWKNLPSQKEQLPGSNLSFYNGVAGIAFALTETWIATHDTRYRDAAVAANHSIVVAGKPAGAGMAWSDSVAITGDSGIILHLLYSAKALHQDALRDAALLGGVRLVEAAKQESAGGLSWHGVNPAALDLPPATYFPNFELGTAGVAYTLARLYEETNDAHFLSAAKQGALHLQSISVSKGTGVLIPYRLPDLPDVYYLGFCHGPAGTARLFYQLHKVTNDPSYLEWTERLAQGVINSGVPANQAPGLWNVVCQCCGTAGLTDFFLGLWSATGKGEYYAFANDLASQALSHNTDFDGRGYRWYQAFTRVRPGNVSAETGYQIGAAGIGAALLHTSLAQQGRYQAITFPDNPFPSSERERRSAVATFDLHNTDIFAP